MYARLSARFDLLRFNGPDSWKNPETAQKTNSLGHSCQIGDFATMHKRDTMTKEESMMKKIIPITLTAFLLTACSGWIIQPLPGPTPFLPATPTPSIYTPTPVVISVNTSTPIVTTLTITATNTNAPISSDTATVTPSITSTASPSGPSISIKVLGCNTSIDVAHGMGEVTNAFVTLNNTGGVDLTNLKATLFALDEGREHPDKTVELVALPVDNQVTVKLTVDSTYKQESPIQVEVTSDQGIFPREGLAACTDIGLLAPNPNGLNTSVPSIP